MSGYRADAGRYEGMIYNRCGGSGLLIPAIALGLWHNFGDSEPYENSRAMVCRAFDLGVTYFDLANNYGVPAGSAEETFGTILKSDMMGYRDQMIITTKAGHRMWEGPYGIGGTKKYLTASLEQSLKKMNLSYVDIFFSHIFDEHTPLEETLGAMDLLVRQGKALYIGVSTGYNYERMQRVVKILDKLGTPCLVHMTGYNMLSRHLEGDLQNFLSREGIGSMAFSPLAGGQLSGKYIGGIPGDSRASRGALNLTPANNSEELNQKLARLENVAKKRGQTLAQLALTWTLRGGRVQSAIIGARNPSQIDENIAALRNPTLTEEECREIEAILSSAS